MNLIRKFFDPAVAEPAASSIAAMMASGGRLNDGNMAGMPDPISEKKEEPTPVSEEVPAATANTSSNPETANPESPTPSTEAAPTPITQIEPEKVQIPAWQEVLKSQQPDTVLKELGYDDKVVGLAKKLTENPKMAALFNHWETNGNVKDYLRELSTDYSEMSAEDVMRHQLRQEYPKASAAQLNVIYKREIIEAYNLDSEEPELQEEGKLLLEARAEKHRDALIANQEKFLLPPAPEPVAAAPDPREVAQKQRFETYKTQINSNPYVQNLLKSNQLSIGEGAEKFNLPVQGQEVIDIWMDSNKMAEYLFDISKNPDGTEALTPKYEEQMLIGAFMKNPKYFLSEYAKHLKSLGAENVVAQIQNATTPNNSTPSQSEATPNNPAAAMAKSGRLNGGGY